MVKKNLRKRLRKYLFLPKGYGYNVAAVFSVYI